ncbi:HpcH/HpaI aldolase/citrate lyase family protein [Halorientalis regularis]|jgi:citrate lyase subunit beta/citryl-CoA lyase|uniref:Citrate lyase subunit beta / citryl-CoA lyase n=1 Tax=Halorientalis regularis TaxID=660518 RepID=A0A1G7FQR1_9EURY|nr:CoA ester lyase [Halorientalis regularis]SDE78194.1 citrate lyase subunit beta / citryl-CoA lyase [Halorientalis regularis]
MARRSVLFSPGDQPDLMRKAPGSGADAVVLDLEDAVAPSQKPTAREAIHEVLTDPEFDPDCSVWVRVNPPGTVVDADVTTALADSTAVDAVMVPKVGDAAGLERVVDLLDEHGVDVPVIALIESAAGVLHAQEIAAADRVEAVAIGAEDLAADIGATRTEEGVEVLHAREQIVLAAAAAGIDALDTIHVDVDDAEGLESAAEFTVQLGFDGKMAIHPAQVPIINDAFTPSEERIDWAERVLAARDEADAEGRGVFRVDDEMIDAPLIAQAEQILERARAAGKR